MYDKNDILARLQNGESADTIASEMAEALNSALAAKRQKDEEAARADKLQKQKEKAADDLANQITGFFKTYYAELMEGEEPLTGEKLLNLTDSIVDAYNSVKEFAKMLLPEAKGNCGKPDAPAGKKEHKLPVEFSLKKDPVIPSDDNIIGKFLKDFGLM